MASTESPGSGPAEGSASVAAPRSQLYLYERELLFVVPGLTTDVLQPCGAVLVLALSGRFELRVGDAGAARRLGAAWLAPHTRLRFRGPRTPTLVHLYDVDTEAYARGAAGRAGEACRPLDPRALRAALPPLEPLLDGRASGAEVDATRRALVADTAEVRAERVALDPRVRATIERMRAACPESRSAGTLAEAEGLSAGRLMHLFKEQTGVPLRRFALWLKTRRALWLAATSSSVTDVAPLAGFADSAHLSRTIHDMFGLWPSYFATRRRVVMHTREPEEGAAARKPPP